MDWTGSDMGNRYDKYSGWFPLREWYEYCDFMNTPKSNIHKGRTSKYNFSDGYSSDFIDDGFHTDEYDIGYDFEDYHDPNFIIDEFDLNVGGWKS